MRFDVDTYRIALNLAAEAHGEQKTPNGLPYLAHITAVTAEVIHSARDFSTNFEKEPVEYFEYNAAIVTALWHDVIEDTSVTAEGMRGWFARLERVPLRHTITMSVEALTKNKGLPKHLQMQDSIDRIIRARPWVGIVKMCDRIVNLDPTTIPKHWKTEWLVEYRDEARLIHNALKHCGPYTAARLKQKIDQYPC